MFRGLWWAQCDAPAHRLLEVRDRLNETFGENRVVGLGHNVEWPPRSPDLTPCDFLCGVISRIKFFPDHLEYPTATTADNQRVQHFTAATRHDSKSDA